MPTTVELQQDDRVAAGSPAVPVIDARCLFAGPAAAPVAAALDAAARETGFLYLENVFAGSDAHARLASSMRRFFALPEDDHRKQSICVTGKPVKYGWMPLFGEPAYQPGTVAHVESFDCGRPRRPHDDTAPASVWPALPGFRHATRSVWSVLTAAGLAVLDAIAAHAGLPPRYLSARCNSQDLSTMRLLRYPAARGARAAGDVGIAAHTDFECLTLLYQSAPGLELLDSGGRWRDAPAGAEQVVVLFGDMLQRWSNGRYRATGHRVRQTTLERYSVVLFFAVNDGIAVEPLTPFCGPGDPARYTALTQREHSAREIARAEQNRDQLLRS